MVAWWLWLSGLRRGKFQSSLLKTQGGREGGEKGEGGRRRGEGGEKGEGRRGKGRGEGEGW